MLPDDKELMYIHLDTLRKEIAGMNDEDNEFSQKLNMALINLREKIIEHDFASGNWLNKALSSEDDPANQTTCAR